ncbi:hypothetical protein [Streptosporangium sp. NPDC049376]|uniref:hypothetical protein n=1 Tax=Streptosporangium sp. NPDC049376 TaxID=3366192 RepID=UPI0037A98EF4
MQGRFLQFEDLVDDGGLLGRASAEVAGAGLDRGMPEQGLDLSGFGAALGQPGG